jgi:enoyl-CoA hydratase/carnithine racemase
MAVEAIGLSRKIPLGEVLRMVLTSGGDRMGAQRAYEVGLVSQVAPLDRLMAAANAIADDVAPAPPWRYAGPLKPSGAA